MRRALVALLSLFLLAGCASVPGDSSVQVLRKVTDGDAPGLPAGPVDGTNPLDLVRGFVYASGSTVDRHGAARRFLTAPAAQDWDDAESLTVLSEQFDTVYPPTSGTDPDVATVRIRGDRVGTLDSVGAFEPAEAPVELDVTVRRADGQWRIDGLPGGVLVRMSDFRSNYRTVKGYFVDPARRATVADLRYLPAVPAQALASRAVDMLLTGPSPALRNAAVSTVPASARLRTNVTDAPDGTLVVDLTQVGDLDEAQRRLLAAQFVQTLAEINIPRVRLLVDGAPLIANTPDLTVDAVAGTSATVQPSADVPALAVSGGRVRRLPSGEVVGGQAGNGAFDVAAAATTADGARIAVVARDSGRQRLLVGPTDGLLAAVPLSAARMSRPTWTPTGGEVWTVLGEDVVARVTVDQTGAVRTGQVNVSDLTGLGPLTDLRLSRDGLRVAAVVGGGLVTGAVVRGPEGDVAVRNVRQLRPTDLGGVVGVDWRADEQLIVVSTRTDRPVSLVSSDGLGLQLVPSSNLTPPLRGVSAASSRPFLVADQGGIWSYDGGELDSWRQVLGAAPDGIPLYPG
ncbi:LpqB family beta-propeller domain-containing protein [Pseudonocardia sp. WMMC193]|uniref:LpqB family beta-propeller domain-containing protein n=1 Tax=Pseudonocardia sp. WMMC193 TaxID=2911965 RepID=UPI001F3DC47E|nr:LpqB family beta-propeller domain-containing protein [Pseudonocardia sp. WMMC193]MCF7550549.1 LpqB family beta-propeller domain-containing protein [Pseudonocardia sp. WMMC193]